MKESNISKQLAEKMSEKPLFNTFRSRSGSILHFNENYISSLYAERFDIKENLEQFEKAFQIVTSGVGNEAAKINSLISSSLLSLLIFHKLFENESDEILLKLNLNGKKYTFNKALFEVRNRVIGYPSCVDIVLKGTDGTLLFLESKFTEYIDDINYSETYGVGYCPLYADIRDCLDNAGLTVETSEKALILRSTCSKRYIEGIKQSVSHLIGLVRGPQNVVDGPYDESYLEEYKTLYKQAPKLIYVTILFDSSRILPEAGDAYTDYVNLYENTIGRNGDKIVSEIKKRFDPCSTSVIEVLPTPITYQELLNQNISYKENLSDKILNFYQFK